MQALAKEVACYLGMDLSPIKIKRFADGEIYVAVEVLLALPIIQESSVSRNRRPCKILMAIVQIIEWAILPSSRSVK